MSLNAELDQITARIMGTDRRAQKKLRLFVGIAAIVLANQGLGPVIGYGIASILGVGIFLVLLDTREDSQEDSHGEAGK